MKAGATTAWGTQKPVEIQPNRWKERTNSPDSLQFSSDLYMCTHAHGGGGGTLSQKRDEWNLSTKLEFICQAPYAQIHTCIHMPVHICT